MNTNPVTDSTPAPSPIPSVGWESSLSLLSAMVAGRIRVKAKKLARRFPFRYQDWQDLEQELLLKAIEVWPSINTQQGTAVAFLDKVLDNKVSNLRRYHSAHRRRPPRKVVSLSQKHRLIHSDQQVELAELITSKEQQARLGIAVPNEQQRRETNLDVQEIIDALPAEPRELVSALLNASKAEVARKQQMQRSTLESRLRRLRPCFGGE